MRRGSSAVRCPIKLKDCTDKDIIANWLESEGGVKCKTRSTCTEENHFCIEEIEFFRRRPGKDESVGSGIRSAGKHERWMTTPAPLVSRESAPANVWYGVGVGKDWELITDQNKYQNCLPFPAATSAALPAREPNGPSWQ